jgi:hypothetical protein
MIISVWRPLSTVHNHPLALCDPDTVQADDLVAVDRVSPEYAGEVFYLKYGAAQKWYWISQQTQDEVCLFLSFDSDPGKGVPCM